MATLPQPEDIGREVLDQYGRHNILPGEMLMLKTLNIWWMKKGGRGEDLIAGLEWLGERGYIEQKEGHSQDVFFLTESGFAAI